MKNQQWSDLSSGSKGVVNFKPGEKLESGENIVTVKRDRHKIIYRGIIILSLLVYVADNIYRLTNNLSYQNRVECFFYQNVPRGLFIFYENFIELWLVLIFGISCAVILGQYFSRYGKFYPRGPVTAFLYGSLMPVCSCSTLPLLTTLEGKMRFRTIITFIMAAPMLSPIIIFLSFSVLGVKYALLRIGCSFILAIGAGYVLEFFHNEKVEAIEFGAALACSKEDCLVIEEGMMDRIWALARKLFPYIIMAGAVACIFDIFETNLVQYFQNFVWGWTGRVLAVVIGVPLYVCNGADIFMLRPLLHNELGLPYGSAVAFSLAACVLCIPSIIILAKILGKRLAGILVGYVAIVCLVFGFIF